MRSRPLHILLNAVAATAGGGVTYLRNVIPHLAAFPDTKLSVLIPPGIEILAPPSNVSFIQFESTSGIARRFWREQNEIPKIIAQTGADVLISAGNFSLKGSPVPQILLSRNSLYTSRDFFEDLMRRRHYAIWLDTKLKGTFARGSINWADATVAPSEAFARELRAYSGHEIRAIHHGFDQQQFFGRATALSNETQVQLNAAQKCFRVLLVSHYNYYRNFETLLRGIALAKERAPEQKFKLFVTCKFVSSKNPGSYRADEAAKLVRSLGIREEVVELGAVPYEELPNLYRSCHAYVTAAYAESFAHPLVEAMSCGLPIIASGIEVHREICKEAGIFFDRFSHEELAQALLQVAQANDFASKLSSQALRRSRDFSWSKHAHELLELASSLLNKN